MSGDLGNSYNIDIWGLLIALGMVAVAAIISELMHMGIGKTLTWSSCRALVQLCAMGFIIGYVIRSNSVWMVFALMAVMLVAAVQIVMSRARGIPKGLAGPIFLSLVITMLLMLALGYWDEEHSPMGLQILLQAQTQALLLLPLIAGMAVSRIRALRRGKEARHA